MPPVTLPIDDWVLEIEDDFDGPDLDRRRWLPHHLPQWSSAAQSAARYHLADGCLHLRIDADQPPWCPEFDGDTRVSSLQTGVYAGELGSTTGQHRFEPQVVVREVQEPRRLFTPRYGAFVLTARAELDADSMAALWMIGFEDEPERSGEICICEIFGSNVTAESARIGMGVHPFGDPALVDDFDTVPVPIDVREFHHYAAVWTPGQVTFHIDDVPVRTVDQSPQYPMQFMLGIYDFAPATRRTSRREPRFVVDTFRAYRFPSTSADGTVATVDVPHQRELTMVHREADDPAHRIGAAQAEFSPDVIYLNTATLGLPPRRTLRAVDAALGTWRRGTTDAVAFDEVVDGSRRTFARLVGIDPSWVAVGAQVSAFVGLVAASLEPGSEILTATGDFTSVLFPFLAQVDRGIAVREVPLETLPDAVTPTTSLVAVSAVQSADGRLADLDALSTACAATGTDTLLDTTQAAGWLPIDASRWTYTVTGGYKWLLAPRGTAFFTVAPEARRTLRPIAAGWYAGEDRWSSIYGSPLRLATDARRFDVSPAWFSWVGQAASLDLLLEVGVPALHRHASRLAHRFCEATDLPSTGSAIVAAEADDQVASLLAEHRIAAVNRAGRLRLSFHVSTSEADVDHAAAVLAGHLRP